MASPVPERILLIRPSALGDVCRTVPLLVTLKRAWPAAQIDWLVQDTFAPAIAAHPDLARPVLFERRRWAAWHKPGVARDFLRWLGTLRRERYDLAIDAQGLARSGLFAFATGASGRVGPADARELGWLAYTRRVNVDAAGGSGTPPVHTVDRMLALAAALGLTPVHDMRLHAPSADVQALDNDPALKSARYAVIAPASRWPGKRWPAERFAAVAANLAAHNTIDAVCIVGSESERSQCGPLIELAARKPRVRDLLGKTSVGGLMALIARSRLVIANDSAALHMAVGFDKPLVALYGPTDISKVGPYRREQDVLQHVTPADRLDHKDQAPGAAMMERITVREVTDRVDRLLLA